MKLMGVVGCVLLAASAWGASSSDALVHRWRLDETTTDDVRGLTATVFGKASGIAGRTGNRTSRGVVLAGGAHGTSGISLGKGVIPVGDAATIEIWATPTAVQKWGRIFDYGVDQDNYLMMSWVNEDAVSSDRVELMQKGARLLQRDGTLAPYALGKKVHVALTMRANTDGSTTFRWSCRDAETGALKRASRGSLAKWSLKKFLSPEATLFLGRSLWTIDNDASAIYEEVRVWRVALTEAQLAANAKAGPKKLPATVEELPADLPQQAASVDVRKDAKKLTYSPMIFGHFIEHFDTQIYGGIFWPGSPLSDEDGFRKDVLAALKEIKVPIVRWPGGCFVSAYHWKYGVGPVRQPMWDKAWMVEDPNTFGTDEYIKWCRKLGCEPYICTNAGTGTPEEMSDWVEYCNLSVGKWGRMRMANGFTQPHNVKYWSVGNENWGGHEIGARTIDEWGPLVRESAKMMRCVDPNIHLLAAALSAEQWTLPLLQKAGRHLDSVCVHGYYDPLAHYNNPAPYLDCMLRTDRPEGDISRTIGILEKAGFGGGKIGIAFDEWNLRGWHHPWHGNFRRGFDHAARRKNDIASTYTMADALFSACFLNTCLRHSDIVRMACFAPIVNTRGPLFVHEKGIVRRTTYHVFKMYTSLLESEIVPVNVSCERLVRGRQSVNVLDAVLSASKDGTRQVLAVVNKSPDESVALNLANLLVPSALPSTLEATELAGDSPNAYNDIGAENRVVPVAKRLPVKQGAVTLAPHSLTFIRVK